MCVDFICIVSWCHAITCCLVWCYLILFTAIRLCLIWFEWFKLIQCWFLWIQFDSLWFISMWVDLIQVGSIKCMLIHFDLIWCVSVWFDLISFAFVQLDAIWFVLIWLGSLLVRLHLLGRVIAFGFLAWPCLRVLETGLKFDDFSRKLSELGSRLDFGSRGWAQDRLCRRTTTLINGHSIWYCLKSRPCGPGPIPELHRHGFRRVWMGSRGAIWSDFGAEFSPLSSIIATCIGFVRPSRL